MPMTIEHILPEALGGAACRAGQPEISLSSARASSRRPRRSSPGPAAVNAQHTTVSGRRSPSTTIPGAPAGSPMAPSI
jgi:hypothetical protein